MGTKGILQRIDTLLQQSAEVTMLVPEENLAEVRRALPRLLRFLGEGKEIAARTQDTFEDEEFVRLAEEQTASTDSLLEIGALISTEMAAQEVADLAFVAEGDLRRCTVELEGARDSGDAWKAAAAGDKALRHLRKALISLESAVHEFEGTESPRRRWFDLEVSLEIRRQYSRLRRVVQEVEPHAEEDPGAALRRFQEAVTALRSVPVYHLLRYADRQLMSHLVQRIRDQEGDPSAEGAARLWQDVVGFVELLSQVNRREELMRHDREVVTEAHRKLFRSRRGAVSLSEDLLEGLRRVASRDDELALLVEEPDRFPLSRWEQPLLRLQETLQPSSASAGSSLFD